MNIPGFTTTTLLEFHAKVSECLKKDDENPNPQKDYGVRSFNGWRTFADGIEAELTSRNITFAAIQW
jgi:hypothetical protein